MIGKGTNKKSMAYVDNVAEFIIYALKQNNNNLSIYNYVDKPDFTMNELVLHAKSYLEVLALASEFHYFWSLRWVFI